MNTAISWMLAAACSAPGADGGAVDFVRDVRPILAQHCHRCHGATKSKGELRLDRKEEALRGGLSGRAISPGKRGESLAYRFASGADPKKIMPPEGERLSAAELEAIGAWIDAGAIWPDGLDSPGLAATRHWAFQPITDPAPPAVARQGWARNPIDVFILARLETEGLEPSPEADRATLVWRIFLDLIGLPPSPEEVDAFVHDERPDAVESLVERCLGSPHYGERWGRQWLDVARYADTNGYEKDKPRSIWPYRDWVLNALNSDLPFDRFTVEQLAGDLLPGSGREQLVATGFHRNTMINDEGGADQEQFRYEAIVDRVNTTGLAFLGLTLGCAQCHFHKYDPIAQREYFQFYAFFNNADEPALDAPTPDELEALRASDAKAEALEVTLLRGDLPDVDAGQPDWEARQLETARRWTVLEPRGATSQGGAQFLPLADGSLLVEGPSPGADTYDVELTTELTGVTGLRIEALPHPSLRGGGPGRGRVLGDGNFVLSEVTCRFEPAAAPGASAGAGSSDSEQEAIAVAFSSATADFSPKGFEASRTIDGDLESGWSIEAGKPGRNVARALVLELKEPVGFGGDTRIRLTLVHNYTHEHNLGRFRVSATTGPVPIRASGLPSEIEEILTTPRALRDDAQARALRRRYRWDAPELAATRKEIEDHRAARPSATSTLVLREREHARVTRIKIRGEYTRDGDTVEPATPACLPPLPSSAPRNRLGLAEWIVSRENPLTARVIMNRIWRAHFGRGLVATIEDFGTRSEPPSHPELLDWLARELQRRNWSLKAVHRLITCSATYRQATIVRREALHADPGNVLLSRAPRLRVEAETVRDIALAAGGILSGRIGGPSVFPPQPEGVNSLSYGDFQWKAAEGEDRFRRGLYTFWKRTSPYPAFLTFDAPTGDATCLRRAQTCTPLQALTLLNDVVFIEASRGLALRVLREAPAGGETRGARAFRICTAREPDAEEAARLSEFLAAKTRWYAEHPADAALLALGGADKGSGGADVAELAAWTLLGRALLNLDETITRP